MGWRDYNDIIPDYAYKERKSFMLYLNGEAGYMPFSNGFSRYSHLKRSVKENMHEKSPKNQ